MTKANNTFESHSPADTFAHGRGIGEAAASGDVIALIGDLGSGKTVLAQGIAAGLGIGGPIASPTFVILHEYENGRLPLYHFDVYRIGDISEMDEIGFDEYLQRGGVLLIEWADLIEQILPAPYLRIAIEKDWQRGPDYRRITRFYT